MPAEERHEEFIRQLKEVGETLIKNARSIVGTEELLVGVELRITIDPTTKIPEVMLQRSFYPERTFERVKVGNLGA